MPEPSFVGTGLAGAVSELVVPVGPPVQRDFIRGLADAHERAGFDAVLVGASSTSPDALLVAAEVLSATDRLRAVVTLRSGLVAPTAAARALATLDALHAGRLAAHLPAVHSDVEAQRDGEPAVREQRQRQRAEFADLLTSAWTSDRPFSYDGEFHHVVNAWSPIRPPSRLPLWISGASQASDDLAAQRADVYVLPAEAPEALAARTRRVGTHIRYALRLRPILASTRAAASSYAERVLRVLPSSADTSADALRIGTGALPGLGSLVGTADDVAETLLRYVSLGVDVFHLVGWQPGADVAAYAELIAVVRSAVAAPESVPA